jgi:hypothetical protein
VANANDYAQGIDNTAFYGSAYNGSMACVKAPSGILTGPAYACADGIFDSTPSAARPLAITSHQDVTHFTDRKRSFVWHWYVSCWHMCSVRLMEIAL